MAARRIGVRLGIGLVAALMLAACGAAATPSPVPAASTAAVASATPAATQAPATVKPAATPAPTPPWTEGKSAAVTGTIDCGTMVKGGTEPASGPPWYLIGQDLACMSTLNDVRVSGTGTYNLSVQSWDPTAPQKGTNSVHWGYQTIKGPDGTWAGRCYGLYGQDGVLRNSCILAGAGGYRGLIFVINGTVPTNSSTADVIGSIQPGMPLPGYAVTPFASGGAFPVGRWTAASKDGTPGFLEYRKDGSWTFSTESTTGTEVVSSGKYTVSGNTISFTADTYCKGVGKEQGTDTWALTGGVLVFQPKSDPCSDRVGVLTTAAWVPAQ